MAEQRLEEIRQARLKKRSELLKAGRAPYPAEARRSANLATVSRNFEIWLADSKPVTVTGRVMAVRAHGGVTFLDLADASGRFQLQLAKNYVNSEMWQQQKYLDVGDWIEAAGLLTTTKRGDRALAIREWHMLAKSIRPLPSSWHGLKDHETRYRQREVDLLLNLDVKEAFTVRSHLLYWLRQYLRQQDYLEVETPILQPLAGGAIAQPFQTHHNALDVDLYLRIAPELYLKRLIVAGYEKVFELGRNFRNEGIDREHNPEFTMLELYWAYADYEDMMDFTEEMLEQMVRVLNDSLEVPWRDRTISFERPWQRVRFVELFNTTFNVDVLKDKDPSSYVDILKQKNLEVPRVQTYAKLVDELYKEVIRHSLVQPTLVYDYPIETAPLAKRNSADSQIAEKFQLIAGGLELINAYTELNDPVEQQERFEEQQAARRAGDVEAHMIDESYIRALEYGMPPVAGLGMGVDRLVMLLTNAANLRDTIMFPLLKPE